MANHFNSFFTSVGKKISNSVPPITKKPEDYVDYGRDIPLLQLGNTTLITYSKLSKNLSLKTAATFMVYLQK
jgi:hypothetical protein